MMNHVLYFLYVSALLEVLGNALPEYGVMVINNEPRSLDRQLKNLVPWKKNLVPRCSPVERDSEHLADGLYILVYLEWCHGVRGK